MPVISDSAIAGYARAAGLTGEAVAIAVAVAIAESGGNTHAHNALPPDNSYGLWQINMLGSMGPARRKQFGISTNEALYEPSTNARAMAMLSNGGRNWSPWTTYTRGTYKFYMGRAAAAAGSPSSDGVTPVGLPGADSLKAVGKALDFLADRGTWIRAGLLIVGVLAVMFGVMRLTGQDPVARAKVAASIVSKVK